MSHFSCRVALQCAIAVLATPALLCCGTTSPADVGASHPPSTRLECLNMAVFGNPAESPYRLPFAPETSHVLGQSYCSPPPGSHRIRFALDFLMPVGTEILAARGGLVVELREHWSDDDRTGGHENMVSLRHDDETISLYLHMRHDGVDVELGDVVEQGGHLGWSGSSGDTNGVPHLHFQVCLRSGMCSWQTGEYTLPVNFNNAEGPHDEAGGLIVGETYWALPFRIGENPTRPAGGGSRHLPLAGESSIVPSGGEET